MSTKPSDNKSPESKSESATSSQEHLDHILDATEQNLQQVIALNGKAELIDQSLRGLVDVISAMKNDLTRERDEARARATEAVAERALDKAKFEKELADAKAASVNPLDEVLRNAGSTAEAQKRAYDAVDQYIRTQRAKHEKLKEEVKSYKQVSRREMWMYGIGVGVGSATVAVGGKVLYDRYSRNKAAQTSAPASAPMSSPAAAPAPADNVRTMRR